MSEEMSEECKRISLEKLLLKSRGAPYEMALRQIIAARLSSNQHLETRRQHSLEDDVEVRDVTSESNRPPHRNSKDGSTLCRADNYAPHPAAEVGDDNMGEGSSYRGLGNKHEQQLNSVLSPETKKIHQSLSCVSDNYDSDNQNWLRDVSSCAKNAEAIVLHSQEMAHSSMTMRSQKGQWASDEYSSRQERTGRNRKDKTVEKFEPHNSLILCDNASDYSTSSAWSDRFSRDKVAESSRRARSSSAGRRASNNSYERPSHRKNSPSTSPSSSSSRAMRGQSDSVSRNSNRSITPRSDHSSRSLSSSDIRSGYACRRARDDTSQQEQSIRPFHPQLAAQKTNDRILAASGSLDDFKKRAAQSVQNYYIRQVLAHDRGEKAPAVGQYTKSITLPYDQRHSASMNSSDAYRRTSLSSRQHTFGTEQYKDSFMQQSLSQVCPLRASEGNGVPGPGQYSKSTVVPYYQRHRPGSSKGASGSNGNGNGHTWGSERYDAFNASLRSSTPDQMHFMSDSSVSSGASRSSSGFNLYSTSSRSERSRSAPRIGRAVTPRDKQLSQLLHMISSTGPQSQSHTQSLSQCPRPLVCRGRYT